MFFNKSRQPKNRLDQAVSSGLSAGDDMVDSFVGAVRDMRQHAMPMLDRATGQVGAFAHRGMDSVRGTSENIRIGARRASNRTVHYIKDEPVKSMLIAAATGAVLVGLLTLLRSSRDRN